MIVIRKSDGTTLIGHCPEGNAIVFAEGGMMHRAYGNKDGTMSYDNDNNHTIITGDRPWVYCQLERYVECGGGERAFKYFEDKRWDDRAKKMLDKRNGGK